ncbi:MAG: hypothetical protein LWX09_08160 [Bacteroidia bacterium]|jgi:hypothetical protein|nr:hypothetical protein [Bacteroidia bacterium]
MENITLGIGSRVKHPQYGKGVVIQVYADSYEITFIDFGIKTILKSFAGLEVLDYVGSETDMLSFEKVEKIITKVLRRFSDIQETVPLGSRWKGGMMILQPADRNLKAKEIPVETFFHKIVMVRDRLRVMEQRINASELSDEDKINLQQYITRIYGSLTTFNILFANKEDQFEGESAK